MKKRFFILLIAVCLLLSGCDFDTSPIVNDTSATSVSLNLCSNDIYTLTDKVLGISPSLFTFASNNSRVAISSNTGVIKTYAEGTAMITARCSSNPSYSKQIVINTTKGVKVDFIDVGQGDAILISLPNDEVMMIDAGAGLYYNDNLSWTNIQDAFTKREINKIDYLVITHNHGDHYGLVPNVISKYDVKNVYGSGSKRTIWEYLNIMKAINDAGIAYNVVKTGDYFIETEDLKIQVVGVQQNLNEDDGGNPNYQSVMIKLTYKNRSYMFTGDAGYQDGDVEDVALKSGINLSADILKVGHHGSAYSSGTKFLSAVSPSIAVITTSTLTETGHPHQSALNRLKNVGANIYQTALCGTISISTNGEDIYLQTTKDY